MRSLAGAIVLLSLAPGGNARGDEVSFTYARALERAAEVAPEIAVAHSGEAVVRTGIAIAGVLPNPSVSVGTTTQTAKLSVGVSVPLVLLGQRGAAVEAGRADLATTRVETDIVASEVRAGSGHAFVALWRAQATAEERERAARIARRLEDAVAARVEVGAAPNVEGLRARADRLRADADAQQAAELVAAAGSDLSRWLGVQDDAWIRADGDPVVPSAPPPLGDLRARVEESPAVRRERAEGHAADARADRERALARPTINVDLGLDAWDSTLCVGAPCNNPPVNYRGALNVEVPILNQRGPYIERELASAAAARAREAAARVHLGSGLAVAYRTFEAWTASAHVLGESVVPAADAAAAATEESYALGRATLVATLDAERARIDARLSLLEARAQQADAWIEVEHVVGTP